MRNIEVSQGSEYPIISTPSTGSTPPRLQSAGTLAMRSQVPSASPQSEMLCISAHPEPTVAEAS